MTGLLQAEEGSVLINGKDALADPDQLKSCIGYVPDFFGVYDNLTVGEYMSFFASCYQLDGLVARKRYTALLEQVGLEDKLDFYVDGLSRGMKQRLCLARALIHDPQILILDEPTSGLDPRTRVEFKEILEDLKFAGKTILISSHVLSELSEMCTDIGIIDQGRMILQLSCPHSNASCQHYPCCFRNIFISSRRPYPTCRRGCNVCRFANKRNGICKGKSTL